jgi:hypothetical protein
MWRERHTAMEKIDLLFLRIHQSWHGSAGVYCQA